MLMSTPRRDRPRQAFTLVEILVSIALIATLIAAVVPTMRGRLREGNEDSLIAELNGLASGIQAYRQNVGHYPPSLDYLNALPTTPTDACGARNNLTSTQIANYRGPYINRTINGNSYLFGDNATISKDMGRDSGMVYTGGPIGVLLTISVDGLDSTTVQDIDKKVDGVLDRVFGAISWSPTSAVTQMKYRIPVRPNTC
jgi:prepilin-type N-terminal cleavage/methylation domain-containing protein